MVEDELKGLKEWFIRFLPKSRFFKGVTMLAGGSAIAQGLAVLVSPILTRLYSPEDFGVFAVYVSILSMISVVASMCYQLAIPLPEEDEGAANLLSLSLSINVGVSILVTVVIGVWDEEVARFFNAEELSSVLWLLPIGVLANGIYQSLNYWVMRRQAYIRILQTKWKQSATMTIGQISGGFFMPGSIGLVLGDAAGKVIGTSALAIISWKKDKPYFGKVSLRGIKKAAYRYRRFPLLSSWSTALNSLGLQIPVFFLTAYHSPMVLGWYALSVRVIGLPLGLISGAVGQVHMAESARVLDSLPELQKLFWKTLRTMMMISLPLVGLISIMSPWLFSFVFGSEWEIAGTYLQILSPVFLLDLAANSIGGTIDVLERQDLHAFREVIRTILMLLSVAIAAVFSFSSTASIICLSIAGTTGYLIHLWLSWHAIRKYKMQRMMNQ